MSLDRGLLDYLTSFLSDRRQKLFADVLAERTRHLSVLVEELYQPHNTNAVLRSCECFGIQDVHVIENVNEFDISTSISMGSHKWLDIETHANSKSAIEKLKKKGYTIVATCLTDDAIPPEDYDISKPTVLMFGSEKSGLSQEAIDQADVKMKIPILGFTESFNVSVSAAILLHYFSSKMRSAESITWGLNEAEKDELQMAWVEKHLKAPEQLKEYYYEQIVNQKA
jgi:tRNA (guanosine-2'-O-)-methyltransferase